MASSEKTPPSPQVAFSGSCACARISYSSTTSPDASRSGCICHCTTCRKLSGGPYQAFVNIPSKHLTFYDNAEHLRYEGLPKDNFGGIAFLRLEPFAERAFCASCRTELAMRYRHEADVVGLTLGTVDGASITENRVREELKPKRHIFVSQKAWWVDIEGDGLPVHERFSGDFEEEMKAWEGKRG